MILPEKKPGPLIAHRGASINAPENTLAAYQLAVTSGFSWIEVDTQLTRDGVPVMMHDPTIDRTTNGNGFVCNYDLAELRDLNAAPHHAEFSGETIPTLHECLDFCLSRNVGLVLEIKPLPGQDIETGNVVARMLNHMWPRDNRRLVVTSFSASCLLTVRQRATWVPLGLATEAIPQNPAAYIDMLGVSTFHVNYEFALHQKIDHLLATGVHIAAATVNDSAIVRTLLEKGIHGVMTDRVDIMQ